MPIACFLFIYPCPFNLIPIIPCPLSLAQWYFPSLGFCAHWSLPTTRLTPRQCVASCSLAGRHSHVGQTFLGEAGSGEQGLVYSCNLFIPCSQDSSKIPKSWTGHPLKWLSPELATPKHKQSCHFKLQVVNFQGIATSGPCNVFLILGQIN